MHFHQGESCIFIAAEATPPEKEHLPALFIRAERPAILPGETQYFTATLPNFVLSD
jgi:hypothetical protein